MKKAALAHYCLLTLMTVSITLRAIIPTATYANPLASTPTIPTHHSIQTIPTDHLKSQQAHTWGLTIEQWQRYQQLMQWWQERIDSSLDVIYIPAGKTVAIHFSKNIPIDYHPTGRKLRHLPKAQQTTPSAWINQTLD